MKYLKKDMVRHVIDLAKECGSSPKGPSKASQTSPAIQAFDAYLLEIGVKAVAELSALMWLGRDTHLSPEDVTDLVEQALGPKIQDIYEVPKEKLGQFLRTGMERLARSKKIQAPPAEGKIVLAPGQKAPEPGRSNEERRCLLAGRFLLDSFREQYGEHSLVKLGELLGQKGYLKSAEDREIW